MRASGRLQWLGAALVGAWALTACAISEPVPVPHAGGRASQVGEAAEEELFAAVPRDLRLAGDALLFADLELPRPGLGDGEGRFAVPHRLRPCCAFGHDLGVRVGPIPLPAVRIDNVVDPDGLGRHRYDGAVVAVDNGLERAFVSPERNGLVYTRRGGFVDLAHVRAHADWTVYLAHEIARLLPTGGRVRLPDEGGARILEVAPESFEVLHRAGGRRRLATAIAQRVAWELSVWHELATWYGWSSVPVFPERVSAFSPEDLYSNALGIHLAGELLRSGGAETRAQYEANMDAALSQVLARLGAVSAECARRAARLVDGIWWDSRRRLPRPDVVLERNFQTGPELVPWRVSLPARGHEPVADGPVGPVVLPAPDRAVDPAPRQIARLELRPQAEPARRALGERLAGRDLASAVERVRAEAQARAPQPDGPSAVIFPRVW